MLHVWHCMQEEKRHGVGPSKLLTQALPQDAYPYAPPSDQVLPEEFAESAKGLAGMDCFELYGGSKKAPELQSVSQGPHQAEPTDDANAYALASCLNTPYTGEVGNPDELLYV